MFLPLTIWRLFYPLLLPDLAPALLIPDFYLYPNSGLNRMGDAGRSFSINVQQILNNLHLRVRMSSSLTQFRSTLKTEIFERAFMS